MAPTNIYATVEDVQALLNALGGATLTIGVASVPTTVQVEGFLDQVSAEIDGILLGQGYGTVPASGTNDVLMIKRHVIQKSAAMVYHAGYHFDDTPEKVSQWEDEYQSFLDRLIDKKIRLVDQSPRGKVGVVGAVRYVED